MRDVSAELLVPNGASKWTRLTERLVAALLGPADSNISPSNGYGETAGRLSVGADWLRGSRAVGVPRRNLIVPSLRTMYLAQCLVLCLGDIMDTDGVSGGVLVDDVEVPP